MKVYVDQESLGQKKQIRLSQVAKAVREVKPHLTEDKVLQYARRLANERILRASSQVLVSCQKLEYRLLAIQAP